MHQIIDDEKQLQAILVGLQTRQSDEAFDRAMEELEKLAQACGFDPVIIYTQSLANPVQAKRRILQVFASVKSNSALKNRPEMKPETRKSRQNTRRKPARGMS